MTDQQAVVESSNALAFGLWKKLAPTGNLAFSPASLALALGMTASGARSQTEKEMRQVLRFDWPSEKLAATVGQLVAGLTDEKRQVVLRIANRLFGERSLRFERAWLELASEVMRAPLETMDFRSDAEGARRRINAWVEEQTQGRIRELVPAGGVGALTRLALVNAIYFRGEWLLPFEPAITRDEPFWVSGHEKKSVPTMHQSEHLAFWAGDGLKAVELCYRGEDFAMLLLLPDVVDGLAALEAALDVEKLQRWLRSMKKQRVRVALPRFELNPQDSLALGRWLQELGMRTAFDRKKADFSAMAKEDKLEDRLFLGEVFHKAFVRVDESGTEAAAATAATVMDGAAPRHQAEFIANHPFLFLIRDVKTGLVLFLGRVVDPSRT